MKESLAPGIEHEFAFRVPESKTVPNLYPESPEFHAMPEVFANLLTNRGLSLTLGDGRESGRGSASRTRFGGRQAVATCLQTALESPQFFDTDPRLPSSPKKILLANPVRPAVPSREPPIFRPDVAFRTGFGSGWVAEEPVPGSILDSPAVSKNRESRTLRRMAVAALRKIAKPVTVKNDPFG